MELQRLNLQDFRHGSAAQKKEFAEKLVIGFATRGFVKLENHGFDEVAVKDMFEWNKRFFDMQEMAKTDCAHVPGPYPQRGYSAIGGENFAKYHSHWTGEKPPEGKRDHKELYDIGPDYDNEYPNRWPQEDALPGFRAYMERTFCRFEQITSDILRALEVGMNLSRGSFTNKCVRGSSEFRMIHYPSLTVGETQGGLISRAWPHYDIGVISLLFQDSVGGLEIDDGHGGFEPVRADTSTDLVVNAAETIQRWSNGQLKAGLHRVTVPPSTRPEDKGSLPQRRSCVYFCKANRKASVAPLPELVDESHKAQYDDLTFLAYHQKRIQAAYA